MTVYAPFAGTLEWRAKEGAEVADAEVLGWISVPDQCALRPLISPSAGRLSWRRSPQLASLEGGEPVALIGEDPEALSRCLEAERRAAHLALAGLVVERNAARQRMGSALEQALLGSELAGLEARIKELEQRWP